MNSFNSKGKISVYQFSESIEMLWKRNGFEVLEAEKWLRYVWSECLVVGKKASRASTLVTR